MYVDTWYRFQCDKCASYNWINYHDRNEKQLEKPLIEGYICWNCGTKELVEDPYYLEWLYEDDWANTVHYKSGINREEIV